MKVAVALLAAAWALPALDASGKAVPNASVWVLGDHVLCNGLPCYLVLKEVKSSDKGEYSVTDVDDGQTRWLVAASAPASWDPPESPKGQRLGWAQTFYPGATDVQLAARIVATPGSDRWNLDIKLAPVPVQRLQGTVRDDGVMSSRTPRSRCTTHWA
jgi:hypothetical protein